ncbi:galactosyl transferase GMA12/MNN10 family-domain-containing protein [Pyronema omphalodes]|nr:galactosyl transferase GMA12/MNN10 family-domain-containing protein [Pyronema omphalodes]
MSRLISKLCISLLLLVAFITLLSFRDSIPHRQTTPATAVIPTKHDSLLGATGQKGANAPAPPYTVSEVIVQGPNKAVSAEEKKKQEEENRRKEEEERRRRKEEEDRKAKEAYDRTKIYTGTFAVPPNLVHDPAGPKPNEIVLLAASDGKGHNGGIDNILGDVTPNRQAYADLHGYTYQFLNISQYNIGAASAVWAKLPAIVDTFNKHPDAKWVWWLDLDAIIMTPEIELAKHVLSHEALARKIQKDLDVQKPGGGSSGHRTLKDPDFNKVDIIIAQDQNGLNAGSFFIRRSEWSRMFIDMWAEPVYVEKNWLAQEQDAMWHLISEHQTMMEHIAFVQQKEINAYPIRNIQGMSWETGDLVVHIAGCWVNNECNKQWKEMMAQRVVVDDALREKVKAAAAAGLQVGRGATEGAGGAGGIEGAVASKALEGAPEAKEAVAAAGTPAQNPPSIAITQPVHAPETAPVAAAAAAAAAAV